MPRLPNLPAYLARFDLASALLPVAAWAEMVGVSLLLPGDEIHHGGAWAVLADRGFAGWVVGVILVLMGVGLGACFRTPSLPLIGVGRAWPSLRIIGSTAAGAVMCFIGRDMLSAGVKHGFFPGVGLWALLAGLFCFVVAASWLGTEMLRSDT